MLPVMISPAKSCPDKPAVNVGGQFVDSGGTVQNLNTLIPAGSGYQIQSATGINDNGHYADGWVMRPAVCFRC
jgi:hypothetical protein